MGEIKINNLQTEDSQHFDERAFEDLYRRMYPTLKQYAVYLIKDPEDAQLLLNDVFLSLWRNKTVMLQERAYLFRALKNATINYHQIKREDVISIDDEETLQVKDQQATPSQAMQAKERHQFLYKLIDQLPERRRLIFYLHRIDGLSYKEIAALLDISVRTVEDHLIKGFQFLQQKVLQNESAFR